MLVGAVRCGSGNVISASGNYKIKQCIFPRQAGKCIKLGNGEKEFYE